MLWRVSRMCCPQHAGKPCVIAACALALRAAAKVPAARLQAVREAVSAQQRLQFGYQDAQGQRTERIVWPFALGYFDEVPMLAAWCECREDFRHFRLDRIRQVRVLEDRYLVPRATLLRRWQSAGHRAGLVGPFVATATAGAGGGVESTVSRLSRAARFKRVEGRAVD